ncbi:MAG: alkaline shock response membrane anchor protein AmaP [Candidatus Omnitrophica bacterium]|nr:alkaline shock response membrane anchor protein AmaP [Candidatus Omnitrophota bacterium]
MKVFNMMAIFIYTLIFSILGAILIALSLRTTSLDLIIDMINYLSQTSNLRVGMASAGLLLILINISIAQLSIGKLQRHKTIAFENPHGQVTLSLVAIEDYIKKLTNKMAEIKDIKSHIFAGKSGVEVITKIALYSDVNIPEVTEKIQDTIKSHLQDMLGIEETITIKVNVTKIVRREKNTGKNYVKEEIGSQNSGFKGEIDYGK